MVLLTRPLRALSRRRRLSLVGESPKWGVGLGGGLLQTRDVQRQVGDLIGG